MSDKTIDRVLSEKWHDRAIPKQCWRNAIMLGANIIHDESDCADLVYVEGYLLFAGLVPIEHGWLETATTIIDPTLPDEDATSYFAGMVYPMREALRVIVQNMTRGGRRRRTERDVELPFAHGDGRFGHTHAPYLAAYVAANNVAFPGSLRIENDRVVFTGGE